MRFNENWLRKWINLDFGIDKICDQITRSGLEVEEIQEMLTVGGDLIIGKVILFYRYPNLKNVYVLRVQIQKNVQLSIISSSCNIRNNMKVVVAPVGFKVFRDKIIKLFKLGSVISEGVLCSFCDINMFGSKSEIIELPDDAPIGIKLKDYNFYYDKIIKINITPNRMDALGIFGIARDVSILNDLAYPCLKVSSIPVSISEECFLNFLDFNSICKYRGRLIKNVNLRVKTPLWMKEHLRRCCVHSVNIVVDILNYVFLELGQSVNVFSYLNDMRDIYLRFANNYEMIKRSGKNPIILNNKVMVISDRKNILSFLGNINFNEFPINLDNKNLLLSSIFIDKELLQHSNYNLKLHNPNLEFFDYYVDPGFQVKTIEYITDLFLKICGGEPGPITRYNSIKYYMNTRAIRLYYINIKKILGYNINYTILYDILKKLGYGIIKLKSFFIVTPPTWRLDINLEEDVISDVMRIYQYDNIFSKKLFIFKEKFFYDLSKRMLKRAKYLLVDRGYHEVINYSFVDPVIQDLICPNESPLLLKNPISCDTSSMRISLFPGLIKNVLYHQNRQYEEIRLFESGLCFSSDLNHKLGIKQSLMISGLIGSVSYKKHWDLPNFQLDFYDLKGDLESLFDVIGCLEGVKFIKREVYGLHPNQSLLIVFKNQIIGSMGALNPFLLKKMNLNYSIFLFEFFWEKLSFQDLGDIKNISEFPVSKRDISVIVSEDVLVGDMILSCQNLFVDKIIEIRVCDVYTGRSIPLNKKSVSLTLIFQDMHSTLRDEEIDHMVNICLNVLNIKFKAILRG